MALPRGDPWERSVWLWIPAKANNKIGVSVCMRIGHTVC